MDINMIGALVGAFGVGGLLTAGVQLWNENKNKKKQRQFEEKKNAYLNYIKSIKDSQFLAAKKGAWLRTAAMAQLELFASSEVLDKLETVAVLRDADMSEPLKDLFKQMRRDLDLYY